MEAINCEYNDDENVDYSHMLSQEQINILAQRKKDLLEGKATSRPWSDIKKDLENRKNS